MNNRFNEISNTLASSFTSKLELLQQFQQSPHNKSLYEIYVIYAACAFLRELTESNQTNEENLLVDSNELDCVIKPYGLDILIDDTRSILNKVENCETMLEFLYKSEMVSIMAIHQFNASENNSFIQSLNTDLTNLQQTIYNSLPDNLITNSETNPSTLPAAKSNRETQKLYIKLDLAYGTHTSNDGILAFLLNKPKILEQLPVDSTPGQFTKRSSQNLFGDTVSVRYIHDCGNLSQDQIEEALSIFNHRYPISFSTKPYAFFDPLNPKENEFVDNLMTAINNMSLEPSKRQPLSKPENFNIENCYSKIVI